MLFFIVTTEKEIAMGLIIAPLVFLAIMAAITYFGTRPLKKK